MTDPYVYPGSTVLRNLPGFYDADLAKPGSLFALPEHIESYTSKVLTELADEQHLRGLTRERFAERLTYYYAEMNAVHPFREGNGRTQRAFLRQLAADAAHSLAWEHLEAQALVHASQLSFHGDNTAMRTLIDSLLDMPDR